MVFPDEPLLTALSSEALRKLSQWQQQDLQNTAWAYYMLSFGDCPLLAAISEALRAQGRLLDRDDPPGPHIAEYRWRTRSNDPWEPWVSLLLPAMAVVMKPASWQVDTDDVGGAIRRYTRWIERRFHRHPIVQSHRHRYGIVHRLDTPSSGLISMGRTFEGYFSLMFQLSVGGIAREYTVLSFHAMRSSNDFLIDSKMFHRKTEGPTKAGVCADGTGKVATTWMSPVAHSRHAWANLRTISFTLITIRIGTGRRHQIRTHITHVGHPTVMDAKYSAEAVFEPEPDRLTRRWLRCAGLGVEVTPLHSLRFRSTLPQHFAESDPAGGPLLNPPSTMLGPGGEVFNKAASAAAEEEYRQRLQAVQPLESAELPVPPQKGHWSRQGPCSKAPRRKDAEGRDKDRCIVCGGFGHWARECPNGGKDRCLVCGELGHRAKDCPEGGATCLHCGKVGHVQRECPQRFPGVDVWRSICFDFRRFGVCRMGRECPFVHEAGGGGSAQAWQSQLKDSGGSGRVDRSSGE